MEIRHDFHIHTTYSTDTHKLATIENYIKTAKEAGLNKLGFAEHFWDSKIEGAFEFLKPLNYEHYIPAKEEIQKLTNSDIKLYFGCEAEYDPISRSPAITEEIAEKFDYIVVPHSHSHEAMPKEYYDDPQKHVNFLIDAYFNIINSSISKYITAMAHPFSLVRCPYSRTVLLDLVSDDTLKRMFDKTAQKGIAVEINTGSISSSKDVTVENVHESELMRVHKIAKNCGCKFIFGSDAHDLSHIKRCEYADAIADYLELKPDDIVPVAR